MLGRTDRGGLGSSGYGPARRVPIGVALGAVVCAFVGVGSAGAAPITVGSPLTAAFTETAEDSMSTLVNSALGETGAHFASPVTGIVVRWHITQASGGPFYLSVLTPDGGATFTGVRMSAAAVPTSTSTQTFTSALPIKAGQTIGLANANDSDEIGITHSTPGSAASLFEPPVADGSTATALGSAPDTEVGFNAIVQPLPTVTGLSRHSGSTRGGKKLTIKGKNFDGTKAVMFGSKKAKSFKVVSDTRIKAVTPSHHAGVVHVIVFNPGRSAPNKASKFRFKHT